MAEKTFTDKQREVVARKMGFEGPMDMFDSYLKSSPADARKYGLISDVYMAKGGVVRKMAEGGSVTTTGSTADITKLYQEVLGRAPDPAGLAYWSAGFGDKLDPAEVQSFVTAAQAELNQKKAPPPLTPSGPTAPAPAQVTPAQIQESAGQFINTQLAPEKATQATAVQAPVYTAAAPEALPAAKVGTVTAAQAVQGQTAALKPVVGEISGASLVEAAQAAPTETAVAGLKAAEGTATQITNAPVRTIEAGELVAGPTVDQARVEAELAKNVAALGTVTEEMTVQGQLNKLLADFEAKNPPAWAASS